MVKPEGVQRNKIGNIISRFEQKGYQLKNIKMTLPTSELISQHYGYLHEQPFFPALVDHYVSSGPVVCMVWQGEGVVAAGRTLLGITDPHLSNPQTIRGDNAVFLSRNVCHASDSVRNAKR